MKKIILMAICLQVGFFIQAYGGNEINRKSRFYVAWGWNTSSYSNSDIHFMGKDYDFTLSQVKAVDKPSGFKPRIHLNPVKLTIPQTNFKLGYFISDKYSLVFGFDHMKYVMIEGQYSEISGEISNTGTEYDGKYQNNRIQLNPDFLEYENTDGLNFIHLELNRHLTLYANKNTAKGVTTAFELIAGASLGVMYPRTDAHLLIYARNNNYHLAGIGSGLKIAGRFTFFKHFFLQPELKGGYINLSDIKATSDSRESVSQSFLYRQNSIIFGGTFHIGKVN